MASLPPEDRHRPFAVSLKYVQNGDLGFDRIDAPALRDIGHALGECLDRTWDEVHGLTSSTRPEPRHAFRPYDDQCRRLQELVDSLVMDADDSEADEDLRDLVRARLFRFRVTDTARLWGFVTDGMFHALWWDPEHSLCDRARRNT